MRSRRGFPAAALALGAVLALAGCDDGGQDGSDGDRTADVDGGVDEDGDVADDDAAQTGGPVPVPTEPMAVELVPGDRSVSEDGSTITVEGDRAAFVTPSANIACVLTTETATCQIFDKTYTPGAGEIVPDVLGSCGPSEVNAMRTVTESAAWTCVSEDLTSDAQLTAGGWWEPEVDRDTLEVEGYQVAVLPYGERLQVGPVYCISSDDGVSCANPELDGRRFELSRGGYSYDRNG